MGRSPLAATVAMAALAACGRNSGDAIALVHRMDVFLMKDVAACAIGHPCSTPDPAGCFRFEDDLGPVPGLLFDRSSLRVVRMADAAMVPGSLRHCFHAVLTDADIAQTREDMDRLAANVSELTGGDIQLDIRVQEIEQVELPYSEWGGGIWVSPPDAVGTLLPRMSIATDFMFAVQGDFDPSTGYRFRRPGPSCVYIASPVIGFGVAEYDYMLLPCSLHAQRFMFGWIDALRRAQHDVMNVVDTVYQSRIYPPCGESTVDPTQWFPYPGDCNDPDSPACGTIDCSGDLHLSHVLQAHWKRGRTLIGNHCRNGREDFDETDVDRGGACSRLGRWPDSVLSR